MTDRPKRKVGWLQFDMAMDVLAELLAPCRGKEGAWLYGVPRGGLCMAVALSHRLNLPLYQQPGRSMIWVDEIVDSGRTYLDHRQQFGEDFLAVCWFLRERQEKLIWIDAAGEDWIVFPWEVE